MSDEMQCPMPEPGVEHGRLMESVGEWNVECTYFMDPGQPPMQAKATETVVPVGPFWVASEFRSNFMGMPFTGRSQTGYDQRRGKWVGTWIDSMSTHLFVMEGDMDENGVLTMTCEGPAPGGGDGTATYRNTLEPLADGRRRFEMFIGGGSMPETKMFTHVYSRAD